MALVETILLGKKRWVGDHDVMRVLPQMTRRSVGPFVFVDHMGPNVLAPGEGFDVKPHPHIGLATVTYLFEGEAIHKDSIGSVQRIVPGDINWMTAGRGIVHSERTPPEKRIAGGAMHGMQLWVALPLTAEENEPAFAHHAASSLPESTHGQVRVRVLAGNVYHAHSPVKAESPLFLVDAEMPARSVLDLPPDEVGERAIYVVSGAIEIDHATHRSHTMIVLGEGAGTIAATEASRVVLLGGERLPEPRFIEWNFVSSSKARIEQAKDDWRARRFPPIPTDDVEFIPLPESTERR